MLLLASLLPPPALVLSAGEGKPIVLTVAVARVVEGNWERGLSSAAAAASEVPAAPSEVSLSFPSSTGTHVAGVECVLTGTIRISGASLLKVKTKAHT